MSDRKPPEAIDQGRRTVLKIGAAVGGGLLIGFHLPWLTGEGAAQAAGQDLSPNAWIRIGTDDSVSLRVASSEMGQGVFTAVPMLLAEELECDWKQVKVEMAPAHKSYNNPIFGRQLTGGSATIRGFYMPLRQAGATGRELLVRAAAQTWRVKETECHAENSTVFHKASNRRLRYGELVTRAAGLPAPGEAFLKDPNEFHLIGKPTARLDTPQKVNGTAIFGIDVRIAGMLTAMVARCPVSGGKMKTFDASKAKAVKGVRAVLPIHSGVAVVADNFWSAKRGREVLVVEWEEGANAAISSTQHRERLEQSLKSKAAVARNEGDMAKAEQAAARKVEADYEVPYLAHACMEPMNCTVRITDRGCEIWVPTQNQSGAQSVASKITGLSPEKIQIHTTFLGGGFGRRGEQDFLAEAVELALRTQAPIKVIWTREDDIQHDFYRPATLNRFLATLDAGGKLTGWHHQMVGASIMERVFPNSLKDGIDRTSVEGAANLPYAIPNQKVTWVKEAGSLPVGFWRSVGSSQNAFVTECFLDEVAKAAGKDPFEFRRALLALHPRHLGVLELAAQKAGWGTPLPSGRARGIAVAESFGSFCAQVAEVSLEKGQIRVHRVVCAIDCGTVINPDTVTAQMESGIVYGLTAALKGEITIKNGRVEQSNFHDYPLLRIDEMPVVDVHIVKSIENPGGVGEPGTPPIAPAVANAVFAITGKPVRRLPIRL
jgi:isoquinoline 1-oxidoreductase beta subunit